MNTKKIIYWSLGSVAFLGLGYLVYRKIADRNKDFIKDGNFTIVIDKTIVADPNQPDIDSEGDSVPDYEDPIVNKLIESGGIDFPMYDDSNYYDDFDFDYYDDSDYYGNGSYNNYDDYTV
jgi:hypothetical protein